MDNQKYAWALPMATGRIYNVWWLTGLDFTHMSVESSRYY